MAKNDMVVQFSRFSPNNVSMICEEHGLTLRLNCPFQGTISLLVSVFLVGSLCITNASRFLTYHLCPSSHAYCILKLHVMP